jgi:acyl carrier protein
MHDLGVDWLARLELVILVEEWTGLELHDDDVERITVVGDLIRYFASAQEKVGRPN